MAGPICFEGVGIVYCADGSPLLGQRRYSFTLLPYDLPIHERRNERGEPVFRPGSMACWVDLRSREPLELEEQTLTLSMPGGDLLPFHIVDVSETPPYRHTTIPDAWPRVP